MVNYFLLTLIRLLPNRPSLRVEREKRVSQSVEKCYSNNLHFYFSFYFDTCHNSSELLK